MIMQTHKPTEGFFDGLVCPQLRVKQVIDGAKWILAHSEETGYLDYKTFQTGLP